MAATVHARSIAWFITFSERYVLLFHRRTVPSSLAVTISGSSGWKRTALMLPVWPDSVATHVLLW